MTPTIPTAAAETILAEMELEARLKKPGDVCGYQHLAEKLGKNPQQPPAYGYIRTARQRFEAKRKCVLDAVPGVGIKWREATEVITEVFERDSSRTRRGIRQMWKRQQTAADDSTITGEMRNKLNRNLAHAGVLEMFSRPATARQIEQATTDAQRALPPADVLEMFRQKV